MAVKPDTEADVLILKAAELVRRAAGLDGSHATELVGVADYLESIPFESQIGLPAQSSPADKAVPSGHGPRPFTVKLTR